jgi:16S rRNA (cytidine1402-2'-O)-methyltransferase
MAAAGVEAGGFLFGGFLPSRPAGARNRALEGLLAAAAATGLPLVLFEAPHRVVALLTALERLVPGADVAACRELTKLHEEVVRGRAGELAARYAAAEPRGEVVLVVGGAPPRAGLDEASVDAVRRLVESGAKPRAAAGVVSELTGAPANALYKAVAEK